MLSLSPLRFGNAPQRPQSNRDPEKTNADFEAIMKNTGLDKAVEYYEDEFQRNDQSPDRLKKAYGQVTQGKELSDLRSELDVVAPSFLNKTKWHVPLREPIYFQFGEKKDQIARYTRHDVEFFKVSDGLENILSDKAEPFHSLPLLLNQYIEYQWGEDKFKVQFIAGRNYHDQFLKIFPQ